MKLRDDYCRNFEQTMDLRRIDLAQVASTVLINNFHKEGKDRCCIIQFNDTCSLVQGFTTSKQLLHDKIHTIVPNGRTRFYDSVCDAVDHFVAHGDASKPWIIIVVTDGEDTSSIAHTPKTCGEYVWKRYNCRKSNYIFTVGVGSEVNSNALNEVAHYGGFKHIHISSFELLQLTFARIMLRVLTEMNITVVIDGQDELALLQQTQSIRAVDIDYAFLIDNSMSMSTVVGRIQPVQRPVQVQQVMHIQRPNIEREPVPDCCFCCRIT